LIKQARGFSYLLDRTSEFAHAWRGATQSERDFIPHPATWFNQERFNDDPETWRKHDPKAKSPPPKRIIDLPHGFAEYAWKYRDVYANWKKWADVPVSIRDEFLMWRKRHPRQ